MCDTAPETVKDNDGDVWTLDVYSGLYTCGGLTPRSLETLRREYGPLTGESHETDIRVLLADALEDVARKLRGVV